MRHDGDQGCLRAPGQVESSIRGADLITTKPHGGTWLCVSACRYVRCDLAILSLDVASYFVPTVRAMFFEGFPVGRISFGVPCFELCFFTLYIFIVPADVMQTLHDHWIVVAFIPRVIWVFVIAALVLIVWVRTY